MGKMFIYHGSYTEIKKPEIIPGRNTKDFGNGFYCTVIREQAECYYKTAILEYGKIQISNTSDKFLYGSSFKVSAF